MKHVIPLFFSWWCCGVAVVLAVGNVNAANRAAVQLYIDGVAQYPGSGTITVDVYSGQLLPFSASFFIGDTLNPGDLPYGMEFVGSNLSAGVGRRGMSIFGASLQFSADGEAIPPDSSAYVFDYSAGDSTPGEVMAWAPQDASESPTHHGKLLIPEFSVGTNKTFAFRWYTDNAPDPGHLVEARSITFHWIEAPSVPTYENSVALHLYNYLNDPRVVRLHVGDEVVSTAEVAALSETVLGLSWEAVEGSTVYLDSVDGDLPLVLVSDDPIVTRAEDHYEFEREGSLGAKPVKTEVRLSITSFATSEKVLHVKLDSGAIGDVSVGASPDGIVPALRSYVFTADISPSSALHYEVTGESVEVVEKRSVGLWVANVIIGTVADSTTVSNPTSDGVVTTVTGGSGGTVIQTGGGGSGSTPVDVGAGDGLDGVDGADATRDNVADTDDATANAVAVLSLASLRAIEDGVGRVRRSVDDVSVELDAIALNTAEIAEHTAHTASYVEHLQAIESATPSAADQSSAGESAQAEVGALYPDAPSGLGYTLDASGAPTLSVTLPAAFGGQTFDLSPFSAERFGGVASWFRSAVEWLTLIVLGVWVWDRIREQTASVSSVRQARGNPVAGGTGAQATALVAAGVITSFVVVALTALLAWSFGGIGVTGIVAQMTVNPLATIPIGILWMLDQLFPVSVMVTALVARVAFSMYSSALYAVCAAGVRFVVP